MSFTQKLLFTLILLSILPLTTAAYYGDNIAAIGYNSSFTGYYVGAVSTDNYLSTGSVGSGSTNLYIGNEKILTDGDTLGTAGGWTDAGTTVELTSSSDDVDANTLYINNTAGYVGIGNSAPDEVLTVGTASTRGAIRIYQVDDAAADQLQFYNDGTRMGEIGTQDTTWLRINQVTNKNILTPRYIRADNGLYVDGTTYGIDGTGVLNSNTGATVSGNTIWHAGNDGTGSGLDADTLDGNDSTYFYPASNPDGFITDGNTGWDNSYGFITSADDTVNGTELDGVFSSTGLLTRTGAATYSTITDSSTNWDTAYTDRLKWDGGSSGLTASTGRTSLGATTVGGNLFTLTNPSAITFLRINADNTVTALDAATFRTAIGAGTGSMSSFILGGDSGTAQTISNGNTLNITGGTGITTATSATDKITITSTLGTTIDTTEITDNTITEADLNITGSGSTGQVLTYNSTTGGFYWDSATVDTQLSEAQVEGYIYDNDNSVTGTWGVTTAGGNSDVIRFTGLGGHSSLTEFFVVEDQDALGSGQDEGSVLKIKASGTLSNVADGYSLLDLSYTGGSVLGTDEQFYTLGRLTDNGAVTWGVDLNQANIWTTGNIYAGATGTDCGATGAACFNTPTITLAATGAATVGTINTGSGAMELGDAAIINGDTNSIPTGDQVYDFVTGLGFGSSNITSVTAGSGLTGGGSSGAITLDIGGSSTITVAADTISVTGNSIGDTQLAFDTGQALTTGSSPQFAGINIGHASDTTLTRTGAGAIAVEGNTIWTSGNDGTGSTLDADTIDGNNYNANWPTTLANVQSATSNDFHNIGGTDDDVPEAGDFGAATDLDANGAILANAVALTTDTTGNYVATVSGAGSISVTGADGEGVTKTVDVTDDSIDGTELKDTITLDTTLAITQGSNDVNFDSNTLFVDGSANAVGIGTNSPSNTLSVDGDGVWIDNPVSVGKTQINTISNDVDNNYVRSSIIMSRDGDITFDGTYWQKVGGGSTDWSAILHRSSDFSVSTGPAGSFTNLTNTDFRNTYERMTITTDGFIGINDTSPSYNLDVGGTGRFTNSLTLSGGTLTLPAGAAINEFSTDTSLGGNSDLAVPTEKAVKTYIDSQVSASGNITGIGSTNHVAYWTDANTLSYDSSQLYWDASSNELGIGTNAPAQALNVLSGTAITTPGKILIQSNEGGNSNSGDVYSGLEFGVKDGENGAGTQEVNAYIYSIDTRAGATSYEDAGLGFGTLGTADAAPVERMRIAYDGKVGVGTTNPGYLLDVNGTGNFAGALTATTLDTGQGANELYDMNQNVQTTDSPTFVKLTLSQATGTAPFTISSTTAVTNLNADMVDGQHYNANWPTTLANIQSATSNDFHNIGGTDDDTPDNDAEVPDAITVSGGTLGSNSVSGTWTTTGTLTIGDGGDRIDINSNTWDVTNGNIFGTAVVAGEGSGSVAMTYNDGYGNANLAFNHRSGVPDTTGSASRIETCVDSATGCFSFEIGDSVTSGVATGLTSIFYMTTSGITSYQDLNMNNNLITNIGNAGTDFTSGGGLTLAGTFDPNGAITLPTTGISGAGTGSGLDADQVDGQHYNANWPTTLANIQSATTNDFHNIGGTDATDDSVSGAELDGVFGSNGLLKRTGAATYTVITDSSSNWDTAYTHSQATSNVHGLTFTAEGSGGGLDADTVDSIQGANFLRSDTDDTFNGKLSVASTSARQSGIYGIYDSTKIGHVWSMGTAYVIAADGSGFGNLYGMAYCHTNNANCISGLGHQIEFVQNGAVGTAIGLNGGIWTSGAITGATINTGPGATEVYLMNQNVRTTDSPTFVKLTLSQATGTAPFTVSSTTAVTNLNADLIDGQHYNANWPTTLANIQSATTSDFHNIGGTDDDTPDNDGEVPNAITVSGGTLGSNSVSGTWTTTGALTIGDGGDNVVLNAANGALDASGNLQIDGDATVSGNDIKDSGSTARVSFSSGNVIITVG